MAKATQPRDPPKHRNHVEGDHDVDVGAVSAPIIADLRLRKLSFTGSTAVGQKLLGQACTAANQFIVHRSVVDEFVAPVKMLGRGFALVVMLGEGSDSAGEFVVVGSGVLLGSEPGGWVEQYAAQVVQCAGALAGHGEAAPSSTTSSTTKWQE